MEKGSPDKMKNESVDATEVGVVIIGRNEGDRLLRCIDSVLSQTKRVVYVDSGSTDGSIDNARALGCDIVELDMARPFTAGRARNEGFQHLTSQHPTLTHVQFIDGDCTLDAHWLPTSLAKFAQNVKIGVVCGRRRERYPDASVYNALCDMEWDTPIGQADACGGDFLVRTDAFKQVNGFDPAFAAGEEPEMCFRLRQHGWQIWRIDAEMTLHDAAMTQFSQWWRRNVRTGNAYANSAWTHGKSAERYNVRESVSIWLWGLALPLMALMLAPFSLGLSLLLLAAYPVLGWRIYKWRRSAGDTNRFARLYSFYCVLGKFPQLEGQARFFATRESKLIEYKGAETLLV